MVSHNTMNVLLCGTGEYTTGYIPNSAAAPDKSKGVVGLVTFDLRRRGFISSIAMCGTTGHKFPAIREHLDASIGQVYKGMPLDFSSYPDDDVAFDPVAYKRAIDSLKAGDGIAIYTPDDKHFEICLYAIEKGIHCIVAKPLVKSVEEHIKLIEASEKHNVLVMVEFHKRWDTIYADAHEKIRQFGDLSYWYSYMSQPKSQLHTFRKWAGKSSDISYYLNSHHIDMHCWSMKGIARPSAVTAFASAGIANQTFDSEQEIEDTITLVCEWQNLASASKGIAVYTASWVAPNNAEVHSQQRFTCLSKGGETRVDQAHRGYEVTVDNRYTSVNPLYMKYTPDENGYFSGQRSYGYLPFEAWVKACIALNKKEITLEALDKTLPTVKSTLQATAILHAGRMSLNKNSERVPIIQIQFPEI